MLRTMQRADWECGRKYATNLPKTKLSMVAHFCNPSTQEAKAEECQFEPSLGYIERPCLKNKTK
jgi:hypothetical protein